MSSVFLSHSHKDKAFVMRLAGDLRQKGHIVWVDEAEIDVGDSLVEKIRQGIDRVDYVAVVISKASVRSKWVSRELDIATIRELRGTKVVVLPVLLENVRLPGSGALRGRPEVSAQESRTCRKKTTCLSNVAT